MPVTPFDRRPSDAVRADVNLRARLHLNVAVEQAYQDGLDRWARDDNAPFPDRDVTVTGLAGMDRVRADPASALLREAPVASGRTAGRLAGQLRGGHPDQQLPTREATVARLDRPDPTIEVGDQAQPGSQLIDRRQARQARHRRVRRPDPYTPLRLPGFPLPRAYPLHRAGALPSGPNQVFSTPILLT